MIAEVTGHSTVREAEFQKPTFIIIHVFIQFQGEIVVQKPGFIIVLVLGIVLAGFVFAAGCPGDDVCATGICGTWTSYSRSAPTAQILIGSTLELKPDMSFTMVTKNFDCAHGPVFGTPTCTPMPDVVGTGRWEILQANRILLTIGYSNEQPQQQTRTLLFRYEPEVPRLDLSGTTMVFYRNPKDFTQWTDKDGSAILLPG